MPPTATPGLVDLLLSAHLADVQRRRVAGTERPRVRRRLRVRAGQEPERDDGAY